MLVARGEKVLGGSFTVTVTQEELRRRPERFAALLSQHLRMANVDAVVVQEDSKRRGAGYRACEKEYELLPWEVRMIFQPHEKDWEWLYRRMNWFLPYGRPSAKSCVAAPAITRGLATKD